MTTTLCRYCEEPIVGDYGIYVARDGGDSDPRYCPYGLECRVHESCPDDCSSMRHAKGEFALLDVALIAVMIERAGHRVEWGCSGGNIATLYAGPEFTDSYGDPQRPVVVGPGYYDHNTGRGEFSTGELFIGPWDAADTFADVITAPADATEVWVARTVIAELAKGA